MAIVVIINPEDTDATTRILGDIANKRDVLNQIGYLMASEAQLSFDTQRFGAHLWPRRYPNQRAPFLNVAGAVSDFARGGAEPKSRRFDVRPALRDTSSLLNSIAHEVTGEDTVAVGTTVPYAAVHQFGGVSSQRVDVGTKQRIAKWLLKPKGKPYRDKLLPLLKPNLTTWDTEVVQRPFLGVTDRLAEDIHEAVKAHVMEATGGVDS